LYCLSIWLYCPVHSGSLWNVNLSDIILNNVLETSCQDVDVCVVHVEKISHWNFLLYYENLTWHDVWYPAVND
jgi:hypothetical protein